MADRARYDGAYEEVAVYDPETGNQKCVAIVKRGGLLPKETLDGDAMPARIRDSLIDNGEWAAVADPSGAKKKED
jgi:hypothetical protein